MAWAAVGALGALGLISVGPLVLVPTALAGTAIAGNRIARRSAFGLLAGAGVLALFVAYIQRNGPGTTCWRTATATGCDQHLNPVPWLIVGVLLIAGSVLAQARRAD